MADGVVETSGSQTDRGATHALFEQYWRMRDRESRDALVSAHLPIARYLAARFAHRGEPLDDLQQVAALGLVLAIDRYDPTLGMSFTTFATPTIIGELKRHFRDRASALKVPRRLQERKEAVMRVTESLTVERGRAPSVRDVAASLEISDEDVLEALELGRARGVLSLDAPFEGDDASRPTALFDSLGRPDLQFERLEDRVSIERAFAGLPGRERLLLYLRYYLGLSQAETAIRLGVSQMHISRLQARALERLRAALGAAGHHDA